MKQDIKLIIFSPFEKEVACFFERGEFIFKSLGAYVFKEHELVLQIQ
jgi:hypothetical protein